MVLAGEGRNFRGSGEPLIIDAEGDGLRCIVRFDLPRVDLDFQTYLGFRVLRLRPKPEFRRDLALFEIAPVEPRLQPFSHSVEDRSHGLRGRSDQVDILRVPERRGEVQLVQRRAATEPELLAQGRIGEQIDDRAADDPVLLDLPLLCPRNDVAPCDDVHHRIVGIIRHSPEATDNHMPPFIPFFFPRG